MKLTDLLRMKLPEGKDPVNVEDFNDNFRAIDKELQDMQTAAGDASKNTVTFSTAAERTNIASTESLGTLMGKIAKWFTDMKSAAFAAIANNETTNAEGYVLDARIGKKHSDQLNGLYFGTDASGKWGFKTSQGGTVTPFRNPTGNAAAADVLSGKTFSSAALENATGSMPNRGAWTGATTGNGNVAIPSGYHNGSGYVSGAGAYNKGVSDADGRVNTESASYKSGYANGNSSCSLHKSEKIASVGSQPFNFNSEYGETNGNAEFIVDVSAYVGRGLPRITFILESAAHFTATWNYELGDHSRSVGSPTYNLVGTALHIYCPYNCACLIWGNDKRASGIWTSCDVYCIYTE